MMTEKIRIALIKQNRSVKDLAAAIGCTSQNLSEKELAEIAEALGYRYEGKFINKETGEEI